MIDRLLIIFPVHRFLLPRGRQSFTFPVITRNSIVFFVRLVVSGSSRSVRPYPWTNPEAVRDNYNTTDNRGPGSGSQPPRQLSLSAFLWIGRMRLKHVAATKPRAAPVCVVFQLGVQSGRKKKKTVCLRLGTFQYHFSRRAYAIDTRNAV